jgi:hypothetical protein
MRDEETIKALKAENEQLRAELQKIAEDVEFTGGEFFLYKGNHQEFPLLNATIDKILAETS